MAKASPQYEPGLVAKILRRVMRWRLLLILCSLSLPFGLRLIGVPWAALALIALACLTFKALAIAGALAWIPFCSREFLHAATSTSDLARIYDSKCSDCRRLYALREPGAYMLPFGIMDVLWIGVVHRYLYHPCCFASFWVGIVVGSLHAFFFRLTSLIWFSVGVLLASASVTPEPALDCLRILLSIVAVIAPTLMSAEIVIGLTTLRENYPRYLHGRRLETEDPVLYELFAVSDLIFAMVAGASAACLTWHCIVRDAFQGSDLTIVAGLGNALRPAQISALFVDFLFFVTATLTTVGYGDIHPHESGCRLLIVVLHAFTALTLIVVVQLALGLKDKSEHAPDSAANQQTTSKCYCIWRQLLYAGFAIGAAIAIFCSSYRQLRLTVPLAPSLQQSPS